MANILNTNASSNSSVFLKDEICLQNIPRVKWKKEMVDVDQSMSDIMEAISLHTYHVGEAPNGKQLDDIFTDVSKSYADLKKDPEHAICFNSLSQLASQLAININSAFNILNSSIKPEVDTLYEQIQQSMVGINSKSSYGVLIGKSDYVNTDLNILSWDNALSVYGDPQTIVDNLTGIFPNIKLHGKLTDLEVMYLELKNRANEVKPIQFDDELINEIITTVENTTDRINDNAIDDFYKLITSRYEVESLLYNLFSVVKTNNDCENLMKLYEVLVHYTFAMTLFSQAKFNFTDVTLDTLQSNIGFVRDILTVYAYVLTCYRDKFSSTLVLDGKSLNGDLLNQMQEQDISKEDVAKHILMRYTEKNIVVPQYGIKLSEIVSSKEAVQHEFELRNKAQELESLNLSDITRQQAVKEVLMQYLQNTDITRLPEGMSIDSFVADKKHEISYCTAHLIPHQDNLVAVLYDFIIRVHYRDSMIGTIHEMLGAETVKTVNIEQNLNDELKFSINATVAARLMARFLIKEVFIPY